jgi:hypothetical protein
MMSADFVATLTDRKFATQSITAKAKAKASSASDEISETLDVTLFPFTVGFAEKITEKSHGAGLPV